MSKSTPTLRRERRQRERDLKTIEKEGALNLTFLEGRTPATKRGRKRGGS